MVSFLNQIQTPLRTSSTEIERAFGELDAHLNLDPVERLEAITFHNKLTEKLKADGIISSAFLQGSFARKTMLSPIRDIDKVFLVSSLYKSWLSDNGGAVAAADVIEAALRGHYPDATFKRSRHALQMDLGEGKFSFDVVPAFDTDDDTTDVLIMDLQDDTWKRSNTRELMEVVGERNKACDGRFVHQVRFVKDWSRRILDGKLPGLHVESIVFACVDESLGHADAVWRIFDCGAKLLGAGEGYDEPTGVERLSAKLNDVDREVARQAFAAAATQSTKAWALDQAGLVDEAVAAWKGIFGELFGDTEPKGVDYLRGLGAGGAVLSRATSSAPGATTTRAWAP
jgi:hypothetical protein